MSTTEGGIHLMAVAPPSPVDLAVFLLERATEEETSSLTRADPNRLAYVGRRSLMESDADNRLLARLRV